MSRTRNSAFEDMIEIASFLPWWVASFLAVISYFIFHYFSLITIFPSAEMEQMGGMSWKSFFKGFSSLLQYLVPVIFGFGALISAVRQWKRKSVFNRQTSLDTIRNLSWQNFELLISEAYRRKDYNVEETSDGPDGGVDIILNKDGRRSFVQCKHWKAQKVGVKEVRELNGIVAAKDAYNGILVTSGIFTADALEFAQSCPVELIDGIDLTKLILNFKNSQTSRQQAKIPFCPKCGSEMIIRTAKKGPSQGNQFWGCTTFPKCKGTTNI